MSTEKWRWQREIMPGYPDPRIEPGAKPSNAEIEKRLRDQRAQQAIYILHAAREIRADQALMAEVHRYIREERDRLGVLQDDLGG